MNDSDLDDLQALLDAATPGVWKDYPRDGPGVRQPDDTIRWIADAMVTHDSAFICAMHNAAGGLIAEVRKLRTTRDEVHRLARERDDALARLGKLVMTDAARLAEVEAIRAQLADARLAGVRAGLAAAIRACTLVEVAHRELGGLETSCVGDRDCALTISEIVPEDVTP